MPQFYFDLRNGDTFSKDHHGVELQDIAYAQAAAADLLADMAKDLPCELVEPSGRPMAVEVRDARGPLFVLIFGFVRRDHDGHSEMRRSGRGHRKSS
jgi:hypothetical protein